MGTEGTRGLADAPDTARAGTRHFPAVVSSRNAGERQRIRAGVDSRGRGDGSRAPCVFAGAERPTCVFVRGEGPIGVLAGGERPTRAPHRFIISSRRERAGADLRGARSSRLGNDVPKGSVGIRGDCLLHRHRRSGGVRACTSARGAPPGRRPPTHNRRRGRDQNVRADPTVGCADRSGTPAGGTRTGRCTCRCTGTCTFPGTGTASSS